MEEIIGVNGVETVLRLSSLDELTRNSPPSQPDRTLPFETVSALQSALEKVYGPRGGRGIALRVGRSTFRYGLKEYGSLLGLSETAFRLLPLPTKLRTGARVFADLFNKHTDQQVNLEEKDGKLYWHIERCPLCWERQVDEPCCQLAVGLLQESLYWLSGGKVFNVEETACIGRGDAACTITIDQTPIS
jgi:predicted hydrocarbon binding protein